MKYSSGLLLLALCCPMAGYAQDPPPPRETPGEPIVKDFESLDKDGDGAITRAEAENENFYNHWDAADKNKDDVVSHDEFVRYIAEEEPRLGEPVPLEELPQAELRERFGGGAGSTVTNPELLPKIRDDFDSLDENNDRQLTRDEVRSESVSQHFSQMDTNGDGVITSEEYNNYLFRYGTQVATEDLVERFERAR